MGFVKVDICPDEESMRKGEPDKRLHGICFQMTEDLFREITTTSDNDGLPVSAWIMSAIRAKLDAN